MGENRRVAGSYRAASDLVRDAVGSGVSDLVVWGLTGQERVPIAWTSFPDDVDDWPVFARLSDHDESLELASPRPSTWRPLPGALERVAAAQAVESAWHSEQTDRMAAVADLLHDGPGADLAGLGYVLDAAAHGLDAQNQEGTPELTLVRRARHDLTAAADRLRRDIREARARVSSATSLSAVATQLAQAVGFELHVPAPVRRLPLPREQAWVDVLVHLSHADVRGTDAVVVRLTSDRVRGPILTVDTSRTEMADHDPALASLPRFVKRALERTGSTVQPGLAAQGGIATIATSLPGEPVTGRGR